MKRFLLNLAFMILILAAAVGLGWWVGVARSIA